MNSPKVERGAVGEAGGFGRVSGDGWLTAGGCLAAACVLSLTLQRGEGSIEAVALVGLGCVLVLSALAVLASGVGQWKPVIQRGGVACLVAALGLELAHWFWANAGEGLVTSGPFPFAPLHFALSLHALAAGLLLGGAKSARTWLILLLLVAHMSAGLWMIAAAPAPTFDVWMFHNDATQALLRGENPYSMTFTMFPGTDAVYGQGMIKDGRLMFGFLYPPLSLYFSTLGQLFGDVRYAQLCSVVLAAALMARAQTSRLAVGAAALFLLTPRGLRILQLSFTEPFVVLLLAATVFCALRRWRALPYVLGGLLAVKQYTIFILPLIPLLTPLRGRALGMFVLQAVATTLLLTLPIALLDPEGFIWSVMKVQFYQPFRMDSLSYLPWWVNRGHPRPPLWFPFLLTGCAIALSLWRAPRTPAGFAAAVAFVYCTFFAFGKQAFINYYYFVFGALCIALAAARIPDLGGEASVTPTSLGPG